MAGLDPATQRARNAQQDRNTKSTKTLGLTLGGLGVSSFFFSDRAAARYWVAGSNPAMTRRGRRIAIAALAFACAATAAGAAPFDVYRGACLDTGNDLAKVRALAKAQNWAALTEAEREQLSPGNGRGVEGWAIVKDGARHLVSISGSTIEGGMTGDSSGSNVVSCGVLTPKADEKAVAKTYSAYLKRQPSEDHVEGLTTYTWAIRDASNVTYHYLVSGTNLPGLSLSVSSIRK